MSKKVRTDRVCLYCAKEFYPQAPTSKYCHISCYNAARRVTDPKVCNKCRSSKPLSQYRPSQGTCITCQNLYQKEYYTENKIRVRRRHSSRKKDRYAEINKLKDKVCMDCKVKYPVWILDFDHRENVIKVDTIANMMVAGRPIAIILEETTKCDVVCANCHRQRTHERRQRGKR